LACEIFLKQCEAGGWENADGQMTSLKLERTDLVEGEKLVESSKSKVEFNLQPLE
jgi:hypothetical protein